MPSNVLSLIQLRTMPLHDQVKTLLTNGKEEFCSKSIQVINFWKILSSFYPRFFVVLHRSISYQDNLIIYSQNNLILHCLMIWFVNFLSAKVIRFSQLLALLPQGIEATAVLRSLQQVAVLVQGCWVVKRSVFICNKSSSFLGLLMKIILCISHDIHVDMLRHASFGFRVWPYI